MYNNYYLWYYNAIYMCPAIQVGWTNIQSVDWLPCSNVEDIDMWRQPWTFQIRFTVILAIIVFVDECICSQTQVIGVCKPLDPIWNLLLETSWRFWTWICGLFFLTLFPFIRFRSWNGDCETIGQGLWGVQLGARGGWWADDRRLLTLLDWKYLKSKIEKGTKKYLMWKP